jgi:acyl-CoA reductase-like NAD-dependent aldehyde dehydrogenase
MKYFKLHYVWLIWKNMMLYLAATSVTTSGAAMMLAELAMEAGLPKGVLNIVHGTHVWYS